MNSIFDFIQQQPSVYIDKLYGYTSVASEVESSSRNASWACKAVYQSMSHLGKNYIMRLLFIKSPISTDEVSEWVYKDKRNIMHMEAIDELRRLRILIEFHNDFGGGIASAKQSQQKLLVMNKNFQKSFMYALSYPSEPWQQVQQHQQQLNGMTSIGVDDKLPTIEYLDLFSTDRWNEVLYTLFNMRFPTVSRTYDLSSVETRRSAIEAFLCMAKLIVLKGSRYQITSDGYEYMLKEHHSQVWVYILTFLNALKDNYDDSLSLLFMLSYCELGHGYRIAALKNSHQRQMVLVFSYFGIIYLPSVQSEYFYPTRVAISLLLHQEKILPNIANNTADGNNIMMLSRESNSTTDHSGSRESVSKLSELKIIVQTNSQVVAYMNNDLHLEMIKIFVDVTLKMPNMVMGRITRDKIKDAYSRGIRALQIISFLKSYAHPHVADRENIIPQNIIDQLKLWDAEQFRIQDTEAVIVRCADIAGMTVEVFADLLENAKVLGLLWCDTESMLIGLSPENFIQLCAYAEDKYDFIKYSS